jgi:hypothetical protein
MRRRTHRRKPESGLFHLHQVEFERVNGSEKRGQQPDLAFLRLYFSDSAS